MGTSEKRKMTMKIFLSLITAAVVLGAPGGAPASPEAIANEDVTRDSDAPELTASGPGKYSLGPVEAEEKDESSVEKRSAIDIDEDKMRITESLELEESRYPYETSGPRARRT